MSEISSALHYRVGIHATMGNGRGCAKTEEKVIATAAIVNEDLSYQKKRRDMKWRAMTI